LTGARSETPHRARPQDLGRDLQLAENLEDIVGLCMSPSGHALVFLLDKMFLRTMNESSLSFGDHQAEAARRSNEIWTGSD
jgi:hypothetical protein